MNVLSTEYTACTHKDNTIKNDSTVSYWIMGCTSARVSFCGMPVYPIDSKTSSTTSLVNVVLTCSSVVALDNYKTKIVKISHQMS